MATVGSYESHMTLYDVTVNIKDLYPFCSALQSSQTVRQSSVHAAILSIVPEEGNRCYIVALEKRLRRFHCK